MRGPTITVKPGIPQKMDPDDASTYEQWLAKVDAYLERACGMAHDDLPDQCTRDWYDTRLRPVRAAKRLLKYAIDD